MFSSPPSRLRAFCHSSPHAAGWGLGEGNLWHKFTNYEHSVRVPLILRAPWLTGTTGLRPLGSTIDTAVELVDIYPTAASITKSGVLANASALDGQDFSSLLYGNGGADAPPSLDLSCSSSSSGASRAAAAAAVGPAAQRRLYTFSDFPRCDETIANGVLPANGSSIPSHDAWAIPAFEKNYCKSNKPESIWAMGLSVRSTTHRYTRWMRWDTTKLAVETKGWIDGAGSDPSVLVGEELYDHTGNDGTAFDRFPLGHANLVAATDAKTQAVVAELRATLSAFYRDGNKCAAFKQS